MTFRTCAILVALSVLSTNATAKQLPELKQVECGNAITCARNSVVSILPVWPNPASRSDEPEGAGVSVGNGSLIATADHVLGVATKVFTRTVYGEVIEAKIVLRDPQTDVALLQISKRLPTFEFSTEPELGDRVCALGNSFGLDVSMSCGVVSNTKLSGVGFNKIEDFVQTDAAVNPGMSGGALVDEKGRLAGMLSAIFTKKPDSNLGVNFAVSAQLLKRIVDDYQEFQRINRIQSGVLVRPSHRTGETGTVGGRVVRVAKGSAEMQAGLKRDDVILFAGNRRIKRAGAYAAALALLKKGDSLELKILRQEDEISLTVTFE